MGQSVTRDDFEWVTTDEPHRTRRKLILEKHPEIQQLFGHDPWLKYTVTIMVFLQVVAAYFLQDVHWSLILIVAYMWGGVINHSMALAIHEISHNLAFGHKCPGLNSSLGIFGNLIMGFPCSTAFKKYHSEHHKYQGDEILDTDIPTKLEAKLFTRTGTKIIWVFLQPLFYTFRPLWVNLKPIGSLELVNISAQLLFNIIIASTMGFRSLLYLMVGTFLGMGLHPMAGHFISEHYMFKKGYETYSYYGPLNLITFNAGYHNEHHDFPNIPGRRLPMLKKMAPEFYDDLPCHSSWTRVIWDFIFDPKINLYSRVKRKNITKKN